ncbi:TPA: pantetheine-phosphate adenylyltransferase [Streptococcus pyogenes]|uniref:pantetheine-phosphate adenylyltransferase n=1 Tax=Streptococcus pyogenes TaxID=1314 RepID=UPI0010A11AAB|nr:pantetheine-phosphate adenylyltransferase [Streptococcus pyogenes]VHE54636.1 pantetheine-phosphate adenylyltransferase [Streptococcus pyogenes]VHF16956.1 pantetheine-phosphate adenylyltransferase [Streptococcus pyogenes]HEP1492872.1 pantetheine-phosphate adenylyltransferase [Streptococcus pyogenes]HEP2112117.1 pantetheine-phosphate adenylyltransferase [Streptococcus pyogenes]HEP2145575.1 pantetheine-phosphate adenylyltransferase [Streptococcus pyogenes]
MLTKIGLYTGSFDPVTNGHLDIVKRASGLFDQIYVGIFDNPTKKSYFKLEVRKAMLTQVLADFTNVIVVTSHERLAIDVAKELRVTHLIRGLRNATDFEYEENLEYFNHLLAPDIETVYLISRNKWQALSSSRVRELIHFQSSLEGLVPQSVIAQVEKMNEKT